MPLLLVVLAITTVIPAVFIVDGLIEGEVQAKGGSYNRGEEPGLFWTMIGVYAATFAWIVYVALELAFTDPA